MNPARQKWDELSPGPQKLRAGPVAVLDAGLRAWALLDLRNRPADEVNGPKAAWGAGDHRGRLGRDLCPPPTCSLGRRRG